MEEKSTATLENIQEAALTEFLDKGFLGASLRQIVKNAGVTTGAFYGYFPNKEALFAEGTTKISLSRTILPRRSSSARVFMIWEHT